VGPIADQESARLSMQSLLYWLVSVCMALGGVQALDNAEMTESGSGGWLLIKSTGRID
jgi:hypothetical protein